MAELNRMQLGARKLHKHNLKTVAIRPGTKVPATKHGVKDATLDDAVTDAYYAKHPDHQIAISGEDHLIIDIDCKPGRVSGWDTLLDFEMENGELAETASQTTPSGGGHKIYYRPENDVRPSVNQELGIDIRPIDSYVLVADSDGYVWENDPDEVPIAYADDLVMKFVEYVQPKGKDGHAPKVDASEGMKRGSRNNTLYKMACGLMAQSWDDDAIIASIETYNANAKDPLPKHEVDKLLRSALALPKGKSDEWYKERVEKPDRDGDATPKRGRPRKFDHSAIGDALMDECGACFVDGMPAIRDGAVFKVGWNAVDAEVIKRVRDATRANQNEVHHYLTVLAERKRQSPPNLVAFENGVLDVETMELRDWEPDDVIPNIVPHRWNPGAECAEVDTILLKMAACDADVYQNLMEVMGCCLYRSAEFGQSAILLGGGSNGKSTYINMLRAMLGDDNVSSLDIGMIGKQFLTGRLVGKLANLGSDISNEFQHGDLLAVFKKVATGDRLYADVKGTEGFEFTPYCQMVFGANEFPRLADYTDGMMRHIFPIEFNATFKRTDPDYDPRIAKKVTTEAACERMCVLAVGALRNVIAQNGFSPNAASTRRVEEIKADNDTVLAWLLDGGWDAGALCEMPIAKYYQGYKDWTVDSGLQAVKRTKFTRSVNARFGLQVGQKFIDGKTQRVFVKA